MSAHSLSTLQPYLFRHPGTFSSGQKYPPAPPMTAPVTALPPVANAMTKSPSKRHKQGGETLIPSRCQPRPRKLFGQNALHPRALLYILRAQLR